MAIIERKKSRTISNIGKLPDSTDSTITFVRNRLNKLFEEYNQIEDLEFHPKIYLRGISKKTLQVYKPFAWFYDKRGSGRFRVIDKLRADDKMQELFIRWFEDDYFYETGKRIKVENVRDFY